MSEFKGTKGKPRLKRHRTSTKSSGSESCATAIGKLRWNLSKRGFYRLVRLTGFLKGVVTAGPARVFAAMCLWQMSFEGRFSIRPSLPAVLVSAGIKPRNLAVHYAKNIPQLVPYRGFWNDPSRNNTIGVLLGIDFLPGPEGYWFIESNLDSGQEPEINALYSRHPLISNLFKFAAAHGFRHMVLIRKNRVHDADFK